MSVLFSVAAVPVSPPEPPAGFYNASEQLWSTVAANRSIEEALPLLLSGTTTYCPNGDDTST
jgi:hypothetical protein